MPRTTRFTTLITGCLLTAALASACQTKGASDRRSAHALKAETTSGPAPMTDVTPAVTGADDGRADRASAAPGGSYRAPLDPTRKVIRNGSVTVLIDDYDAAYARLEALVQGAGGYVDATNVVRRTGAVSDATIVIRVPADRFGGLVHSLAALGELQAERTDATDITAAFVDTAARRDSARALEARLLELVQARTGTVSDVLEVERELARVRGEIEQYEGQLRLWNDQTALATLTLSLTTRTPELVAAVETTPGFSDRSSSTFNESVAAAVGLLQALGLALIALVPWLPLLIPLGVLTWKLARRFGRQLRNLPRAQLMVPAMAMPYPPYPMAAPSAPPMAAPSAPPNAAPTAAPSEPPAAAA